MARTVRGLSLPGMGGPTSTCIPCGSALGATWDPALAEQLGALVGREALDRGCRGLLAPTVNLHRHPLAGRNFECYSEDPLLSGRLAAGYVRGVQSAGVFATVKHFVGNEAEYERGSISSVIDERSLRELYLLPFEIAVREGGALGLMTSYNRLNGRWLTERPDLLVELVRGEWGFEGLVMTDWFAVADTSLSLGAGLDLEMPGPGRALGSTVVTAVNDGRVKEDDLDVAVRRLLSSYDRIGALVAAAPDVAPVPPGPEDLELLRRSSAESIVLLRNDGTLPLEPSSLRRVAIVGQHAVSPCVMGGGSAGVATPPLTTPLESVSALLGDASEVVYERGCEADVSATPIGERVLVAPDGFDAAFHAGPECAGEVLKREKLDSLRFVIFGSMPDESLGDEWSVRVRGSVVPDEDGRFEVVLAQSGRARVLVDGEVLLDGFENPMPAGGSDFFGLASKDLSTDVAVRRGVPLEVVVEYANIDAPLAGFRVGFRTVDKDALLQRAIDAAAGADVAVVVVGNSAEWETEGRDRPAFELPGRQPELIRRVAAVNNRTVVVVNAGAPVDLSWSDDVAAVLQCWFGGQEMASGVAGVLGGELEPGGRLPTSIPLCLEHSPSYDSFPGENGEVRYGEGLFMGYRGYEHRRILPAVPLRPRAELHDVHPRGARPFRPDHCSGRFDHDLGARHEHGPAPRLRGDPVLRRPLPTPARSTTQGAQGIREGPAGAGRIVRGTARAEHAGVRLLGSGSVRLGGGSQPAVRHVRRPLGPPGSSAGRVAGRRRGLRSADRPVVGRHRCDLCRADRPGARSGRTGLRDGRALGGVHEGRSAVRS